MELSAKLVRSQLNFFKPFVAGCSLETTRKGQDKLGELMSALHKREVIFRDHDFEQFKGAWVMPKDERRSGVVLYLTAVAIPAAVWTMPRALRLRWPASAVCACSAGRTAWRRRTPIPPRWRMH